MKTDVRNLQPANQNAQMAERRTEKVEKPLTKKASEMKAFLANNPIPKEIFK